MPPWFWPHDEISNTDVRRGLRLILFDGICSQIMGSLTGGAFLVAFALLLGASNTVIGVLAGVGPLTQILQIPTILVVERVRLRKMLVVGGAFISRLFWIPIMLLPWIAPPPLRVPLLLVCLAAYFGLGAIAACAWNSWLRDLVPEQIFGRYFGRRLAIATVIGAGVSLVAAYGLDLLKDRGADPLMLYSGLLGVGAAWGIIGVNFLARIPEPRMAPGETHGILRVLLEPVRDRNFRRLLIFLGWWTFAMNLAAPFFPVYMLRRLELNIGLVIGLSVASQIVNALFLGVWGRIADRFSNKSVLSVAGPLFVFCIGLWPFTTMPDRYWATLPLLVAIHLLAGISTAGVTLCSSNIALELAPRGRATAFLATAALTNGLAASVAPVLGGVLTDMLQSRELSLVLRWGARQAGVERQEWPALDLFGLDFIFVVAFFLGLFAMSRLVAVREEGHVKERIVITELWLEVRKVVRSVSNVAGLRDLTYFPWFRLRDALTGRTRDRTEHVPEK